MLKLVIFENWYHKKVFDISIRVARKIKDSQSCTPKLYAEVSKVTNYSVDYLDRNNVDIYIMD